ncbi:putative damage-inducible protein DinB [Nonlabens dokdonensis]|jgi:uncharacterized damage-inducible protein DinB|uniref:DinB family protein n=2 Tax=Nonlabens dokdonensis TaxID=328515 RepID=L7W9B2_NONDD|nr:DinB family protein [Nonlabens dokdonensis]AGC76734.1 DinB family protein [Nonlabens dokdonensis DSW-6]PZX44381.1 putative damage-inducible protein DinB [Nonlabens dokdonensis]
MQKLLLFCILLSISTTMAQQTTFKGAFLEKWNNSRDYILEVAEAMPEEYYDYKPTPKQMSFKEQLIHIQGNIMWLDRSYFSQEQVTGEPKDYNLLDKAALIQSLKNTFDDAYRSIDQTQESDLKETVKFFAGPKSKLQIMNLMQDHVSHHRGQLLVYLNLKGITPPGYSGW